MLSNRAKLLYKDIKELESANSTYRQSLGYFQNIIKHLKEQNAKLIEENYRLKTDLQIQRGRAEAFKESYKKIKEQIEYFAKIPLEKQREYLDIYKTIAGF